MDYSEFIDSSAYKSSPAGAQLAAQITDENDPTKKFVGLLTLSLSFNNELVPIREGGESMLREIARGAGEITGQVSMVFTSERNDALMPMADTFLSKGPYTTEVFDGDPWTLTGGTVRFAITGMLLQNYSTSIATQGQVDINFSFMATRMYTGEAWSALGAT